MLEDSPSLGDYNEGLPPTQQDAPHSRKAVRLLLLVLVLVVLGLSLVRFLQSEAPAKIAGTGQVTGIVISEAASPLPAEIIVLGTDIVGQADSQGQFLIRNIPAGQQSIAILHLDSGVEYPAFVNPGQTTDLGKIKLIATTEPSQ